MTAPRARAAKGSSGPEPWAASHTMRRGGVKSYEGKATGIMPLSRSCPFHKTVDHLLLACLVEGDGELVAVDLHHMAVAELLVEHAVVEIEFGDRAGGFRHQLALDGDRRALLAARGAEIPARARGIASRA